MTAACTGRDMSNCKVKKPALPPCFCINHEVRSHAGGIFVLYRTCKTSALHLNRPDASLVHYRYQFVIVLPIISHCFYMSSQL